MVIRVLPWIVAVTLGCLLLCAGTSLLVVGGGMSGAAGCVPAASGAVISAAAGPAAAAATQLDGFSREQTGNAATIVAVGRRLAVAPRGWVVAVATAMQESSLINTSGGDRDSVGLFQQRPSQGWGSPQQLHDPVFAATRFYTRLQTVPGWQALPLTEAAQAVQRSAYPDAYAKWEPAATAMVAALSGRSGIATACSTATISAQGWTQPVHGPVGSGFRTPQRPSHDGVDLIVAKGTPVHAAAAGTVSRVRCDAVDVRTGAPWGCDRDGDPSLTAGCGWYVDIDHAGGVVTRYCHQLVHPFVHVGQHVEAGEVIGLSGSSGHSSGPHVHFEVHLGNHASATAIDPVAFMATVAAPLGH